MALSTISGTTGITDATITSAKLADFSAAVDLNGVELILDANGNTSITADTDDRIDFKLGGVEHISLNNSSGDTVIKPMVDGKDIVFQQYDGNKILEINDGNYVAISGAAAGPGELRFYEDTDLGSHYTGLKAGNATASVSYVLPLADGTDGYALTTDGSGTLSWSVIEGANPSSADGDTLGTASLEWSDLFLADGGVINLGNDQDVTLTHVADTGILLNSTMAIQFNDASQYINAPSNAILDINATDEIELNATAIDINGTCDVSGAFTAGSTIVATGNITGPQILATSSCKPSVANGASLGSADLEWADLYLHDGAQILFGADQEVTLTHVADTGLLLNSTMAIQFNDASQYINAPSNAILDINATDEIELNATLVDVNANLDVSGTITSGGVVTGTAFTAGSAVLAEAELELLDGLTAGTAIASKVVTTDASIDTTGQRNLTITGELDAATLDISGAIDIAGASVLHGLVTQDGGAVFNEASADVDFRVESNGNANMLFVDGGNNRVGVGTNIPSVEFEIADSSSDCEMTIGSWADNVNTKSALNFVKSRNSTIGTGAATATNENIGEILAYGYDTGNTARAATQILFMGDAAPDGDNVAGKMLFKTNNNAGLQTALTIDDSQDAVFAATVSSTGDTKITSGDLVFATAGKGICLGVTSNTDANTLDDYEEGTYEPTIVGSSSGNYVCSTNKTLSYTKVGRMVNISGKLMPDTDNSISGTLFFSLPFTGVTDSETEAETAGNCFMRSGGTEIPNNISALVGAGASTFYITYSKDDNVSDNVTHAQVDAAFDVWFGFWYMAA